MPLLHQHLKLSTSLTPEHVVDRLAPLTRPGFPTSDNRDGAIGQLLDDSGASDLYQGWLSVHEVQIRRLGSSVLLRARLARSGNQTFITGVVTFNRLSLVVLWLFATFPFLVAYEILQSGLVTSHLVLVASALAWCASCIAAGHWNIRHSGNRFERHLKSLLSVGAPAAGPNPSLQRTRFARR